MSSPTPRGEATREQIAEAAYQLFMEHGFHATSMRQIAQKAGIALGGIYNHYASKDEIFVEVLRTRHPFLTIIPLVRQAQGETIQAWVQDVARRMIQGMGANPDLLNLMFIEMVEFKGIHYPIIFNMLFPEMLWFANYIRRWEGQVRPLPPFIIIRAFVGLFFSYFMTEMMLGSSMPAELRENALDHFVDIFLHGVLAEQRPGLS